MIISKNTRYFEGQKTVDTPLTVRDIIAPLNTHFHQNMKPKKTSKIIVLREILFCAENDSKIITWKTLLRKISVFWTFSRMRLIWKKSNMKKSSEGWIPRIKNFSGWEFIGNHPMGFVRFQNQFSELNSLCPKLSDRKNQNF